MPHDSFAVVGLHRVMKRAKTSSSTTPKAAATTPKATSSSTPAVAGLTPTTTTASGPTTFAPGAAYTGKATKTAAATTPPTNHVLNTSAGSNSFSFASLASGATPANSATSPINTSPTGAIPILSHWATIGIIAGAGAVGVLIFAMLFWWCCRRYKKKKEERSWWKINSSQPDLAVGKPVRNGGGGGDRDVDSDWTLSPTEEKDFIKDMSPGLDSPTDGFGRYGFSAATPQRPVQQNSSINQLNYSSNIPSPPLPISQPTRQLSDQNRRPSQTELNDINRRARDELLGFHNSQSNRSVNEMISFGGSQSSYSIASSAYPQPHPYAQPNDSSASAMRNSPVPPPPAFPLPQNNSPPPTRPARPNDRPSDEPQSRSLTSPVREGGRSPFSDPEMAAVPQKAKKRQSMHVNTSSEIEPQYNYPPSPVSPPPKVNPPKRGASKASSPISRSPPPSAGSAGTPNSPPSALAYTLPSAPSRAAVVDSFPSPPRSPVVATSTNNSSSHNNYGRVDSKPLRDLEDILDSFGYDPSRRIGSGPTPPVPDRASSVASTVTPLTNNHHNIRNNTPSPSSYALSPSSANPQYAMNHHTNSIYSSQGDIGELPSTPVSRNGSPSPTPTKLQSSFLPPESPTKIVTPLIMRSDSEGHDFFSNHGGGGRDSDYDVFNFQVDSPSSTAASIREAETKVVRKVSLKKGQTPVLLKREESLRRNEGGGEETRRPTTAEREVIAQMGFDSPIPPPATLPSTEMSLAPPASAPHFAPVEGFEPLSSMTLDSGHYTYRSATESIYGMYNDLPAELRALPRDDPRVSRHLSQYGGQQFHQR